MQALSKAADAKALYNQETRPLYFQPTRSFSVQQNLIVRSLSAQIGPALG